MRTENASSTENRDLVLAVDDDTRVLEVMAQILDRLGFRVVTADTGQKAIDLVSQSRDRIRFAILDVDLGDMDGIAVFRAIRTLDPAMKVVFSSGYAMDVFAEIACEERTRFLQKPFGLKALSALLDDIFAETKPEAIEN